jgi:hypothetical protein
VLITNAVASANRDEIPSILTISTLFQVKNAIPKLAGMVLHVSVPAARN